MVVDGLTAAQIARRLQLSPRTVENHIARVKSKIGLRNRAALVTYALEHELVARPRRVCPPPPLVLPPMVRRPPVRPLLAHRAPPGGPPPDDTPTDPAGLPVLSGTAACAAPRIDPHVEDDADQAVDTLCRDAAPVGQSDWLPLRPLADDPGPPTDADDQDEEEDDDDWDEDGYQPRRWPTVLAALAVLAVLIGGLLWYRGGGVVGLNVAWALHRRNVARAAERPPADPPPGVDQPRRRHQRRHRRNRRLAGLFLLDRVEPGFLPDPPHMLPVVAGPPGDLADAVAALGLVGAQRIHDPRVGLIAGLGQGLLQRDPTRRRLV
jgi:hypothetical protein